MSKFLEILENFKQFLESDKGQQLQEGFKAYQNFEDNFETGCQSAAEVEWFERMRAREAPPEADHKDPKEKGLVNIKSFAKENYLMVCQIRELLGCPMRRERRMMYFILKLDYHIFSTITSIFNYCCFKIIL